MFVAEKLRYFVNVLFFVNFVEHGHQVTLSQLSQRYFAVAGFVNGVKYACRYSGTVFWVEVGMTLQKIQTWMIFQQFSDVGSEIILSDEILSRLLDDSEEPFDCVEGLDLVPPKLAELLQRDPPLAHEALAAARTVLGQDPLEQDRVEKAGEAAQVFGHDHEIVDDVSIGMRELLHYVLPPELELSALEGEPPAPPPFVQDEEVRQRVLKFVLDLFGLSVRRRRSFCALRLIFRHFVPALFPLECNRPGIDVRGALGFRRHRAILRSHGRK
mmetsp:Transcript_928/g.1393  ORF Transcript_928/g.1393 Transcript_928/m.1393 type:complete len:271 (+) Transcript_928:890-1702(+)